MNDEQVAEALNHKGLRSSKDRPFTRSIVQVRISANVTSDFGNVTDFGRCWGCAKEIVVLGLI